MEILAVPEAAQQRVKQLYAAYALSRQDLACFTEGLLLGLGLVPDDWNLDIPSMTFQEVSGGDRKSLSRSHPGRATGVQFPPPPPVPSPDLDPSVNSRHR